MLNFGVHLYALLLLSRNIDFGTLLSESLSPNTSDPQGAAVFNRRLRGRDELRQLRLVPKFMGCHQPSPRLRIGRQRTSLQSAAPWFKKALGNAI